MNEDFRAHVTATGFALLLTRTQLAALVCLDLELKFGRHIRGGTGSLGGIDRLLKNDAMGRSGLIARGLIKHVTDENRHRYRNIYEMPIGMCWHILPAGRLVCELLKEAGVYQEYEAAILEAEAAESVRSEERAAQRRLVRGGLR